MILLQSIINPLSQRQSPLANVHAEDRQYQALQFLINAQYPLVNLDFLL
jgi:hypothetical protein